jgi:glycosyltransferase involved in cell wall biosynthesis
VKILQIIDNLDFGGAERMAVNIANAFHDNGIANILCITRLGGAFQPLVDKNIPVYLLNKKHVMDLPAFLRLLRIIAEHKPSIIHAHSSSYVWAILAKLFFPKIKLIWHDHRGVSKTDDGGSQRILGYLSRRMNGIVVVNEALKNKNLRKTVVPERYIRFIKNFPDLRAFAPEEKDPSEKNILCLANFRPEKDHVMLLKAFSKLVANFPVTRLNLWLAGKTFDPQYKQSLHQLAEELNIAHLVCFLGNVHDTKEVLAKAHIGVLSSKYEGLPVSLLEYGLAQLPVLVTDTGHCREVLENGKCGWLAKPQDADDFAATLQEMIEKWPESLEKSERLRDRVVKEYGSIRFVKEYVSFLHSIQTEKVA